MARSAAVKARPYVLLSAAASLDGYLDDSTDTRLLLSNDEDFDRVDELRAGADAIMVGAGTVRLDDPRLLVRSPVRRRERGAAGLRESPTKVTLTSGGDLDPAARFFTTGDSDKLVYVASSALAGARERLAGEATLVDAGQPLEMATVLADLCERGVARLMVEGGGTVHTCLLKAGLVDELQLVYAPFFLGARGGARFVGDGVFPQNARNPMTLAETRQIGDLVLLRYLTGGDA